MGKILTTQRKSVIAGLDPAIHPLRKTLARMRGSSPRMNHTFVIAGLDPAIHPLRKDSCEEGWMRGSSPRMTSHMIVIARSSPRMTLLFWSSE
jgi:hypothetical protein